MIPIRENYKFGTDPTMEDQIKRTNNCQKIAVSNPTQAGQRFTWSKKRGAIDNNYGRQ